MVELHVTVLETPDYFSCGSLASLNRSIHKPLTFMSRFCSCPVDSPFRLANVTNLHERSRRKVSNRPATNKLFFRPVLNMDLKRCQSLFAEVLGKLFESSLPQFIFLAPVPGDCAINEHYDRGLKFAVAFRPRIIVGIEHRRVNAVR